MTTQITNTGLYDHPVVAMSHPKTGIHLFFRRSIMHPGNSEGRLYRMFAYPDGTYSLPAKMFPDPSFPLIDETELHGGLIPSTNTLILFVNRYNRDTLTFINTVYRSTNGGLSFNNQGVLDTGTATDFAVYGRVIEMPWTGGARRLLMSVYEISPTPKVWVVYSDDDGATWHTGSTITTGGFSEGCLAYVDGTGASARIIYVSRKEDPNDHMHQFVSADGGATWTDQGPLAFTSLGGGAGPVSPDLLVLADGRVVFCWGDRKTWLINYVVGVGSDLAVSITAWGSIRSIYKSNAGSRVGSFYGNFGYPSMVIIGGAQSLENIDVFFNDQDRDSVQVGLPPDQPSVNLYRTSLVRSPAYTNTVPSPFRVLRDDGLEFLNPKIVRGAWQLDPVTGSVTVPILDGFTAANTYDVVSAFDRTSWTLVSYVKNSGHSITFTGTPGHVVVFTLIGN